MLLFSDVPMWSYLEQSRDLSDLLLSEINILGSENFGLCHIMLSGKVSHGPTGVNVMGPCVSRRSKVV